MVVPHSKKSKALRAESAKRAKNKQPTKKNRRLGNWRKPKRRRKKPWNTFKLRFFILLLPAPAPRPSHSAEKNTNAGFPSPPLCRDLLHITEREREEEGAWENSRTNQKLWWGVCVCYYLKKKQIRRRRTRIGKKNDSSSLSRRH